MPRADGSSRRRSYDNDCGGGGVTPRTVNLLTNTVHPKNLFRNNPKTYLRGKSADYITIRTASLVKPRWAHVQMQLVGGTVSCPRLSVSAVITSAIAVSTLLLRLLPTTTLSHSVRRGEGRRRRRRRFGRVQHVRHGWYWEPGRKQAAAATTDDKRSNDGDALAKKMPIRWTFA